MADERPAEEALEVDDFLGDEEEKSEDVVYSINSFGADFLVDGLIARLEQTDIYVPDFQRGFVWKVPQASRFIESILLGLPIPGIFLYREDDTNKLIIVDGLQRLTTLHSFHRGFLPDTNRKFALKKVQEKYEGKTFDTLDPADRRRFLDTVIHATIIQQTKPKNDLSSIYYIFERLNTGGTPLQPQEVRAALYHGPLMELLKELNENESWRLVFGPESKRAKDIELILRFFALLYRRDKYTAPMKRFLNDFSSENRTLTVIKAERFRSDFEKTVEWVARTIGREAFRPVRALNAAALDSIMVVVAENRLFEKLSEAEFAERYKKLMADADFLSNVGRSTADEARVRARIDKARQYLAG